MNESRSNLLKFAHEIYTRMPNHRHYALDEDAKNVLTAIASAVFSKRAADGRTDSEKPNAREEFAQVIQALADAGCNLLQSRPSDPEALPKPWVDEVTGAQLPNPFAKATADLTAQAILMKRDPALAQHLKAMADDPYGTLAKLQDEEAERQALASIPYDDKIHQLNPFLGDNLRAQDEFVKRDRELAKFYKEEARPVEIPLFGKNRNLTLEGRLYRDPHAASVLKVGAALSRQWLESDRQAAGEQRAKAEAEIARLEKQIA